uniref:Variant surface glycoprotein 1125.1469 n=1 Tax=Trypanosoma brucei TaxID=5691 RepID=A0A1J0R796_9TRYP|nr:variant surface glycoprotein 1125.1469 [Trypanosoma brucei]
MFLPCIALVAMLARRFFDAANITTAENKIIHGAVCEFVGMLDRPVDVQNMPLRNDKDYNFLQAVNFSLAPEEWQKKFYTDAERKAVQPSAEAAKVNNQGGDKWWPSWKKAAETVKAENKAGDKIKQAVEELKTRRQKDIAQAEISALTEEAKEALDQYPTGEQLDKELTEQAAQATITAAVLGTHDAKITSVTDEQAFGAAITGTARDAVCKAQTTKPNANTAAAILACICAPDATTPVTGGACTPGLKSTHTWTSTGGNLGNTKLAAFLNSCKPKTTSKVTATKISTAIKNLRQHILADTSNGYLVAFWKTGCTGSSASWMFVTFTNLAADERKQ